MSALQAARLRGELRMAEQRLRYWEEQLADAQPRLEEARAVEAAAQADRTALGARVERALAEDGMTFRADWQVLTGPPELAAYHRADSEALEAARVRSVAERDVANAKRAVGWYGGECARLQAAIEAAEAAPPPVPSGDLQVDTGSLRQRLARLVGAD